MRPHSFSEEQDIYQNKFLRLYSVKADFGEFEKEYFVVDKGQRAGVLILKNDEILLVRQYRFLIDGMSWELPGGGLNDSEDYELAAIRECKEEAGIICANISPLLQYHQGIDTTLSPAHLFTCTEFTVQDEFKNQETDERKWFPFAEALDMVMDGRIEDSLTIVGLLAHYRLSNKS
jgi:8-oxo-dGTP pyrophosphatase MutT (NUDIX family)